MWDAAEMDPWRESKAKVTELFAMRARDESGRCEARPLEHIAVDPGSRTSIRPRGRRDLDADASARDFPAEDRAAQLP